MIWLCIAHYALIVVILRSLFYFWDLFLAPPSFLDSLKEEKFSVILHLALIVSAVYGVYAIGGKIIGQ